MTGRTSRQREYVCGPMERAEAARRMMLRGITADEAERALQAADASPSDRVTDGLPAGVGWLYAGMFGHTVAWVKP